MMVLVARDLKVVIVDDGLLSGVASILKFTVPRMPTLSNREPLENPLQKRHP